MRFIVALGNPGAEYATTRHNAGWMLADELQRELSGTEFKLEKRFEAELSMGARGEERAVLIKPQTFMNESGRAVQKVLNFYRGAPAQLLVVHDDKDIPLGSYRLQTNRGAAGHNGVDSIIEALGTRDFTRLRIGIGQSETDKLPVRIDTAEFVLNRFSAPEKKILSELFSTLIAEVERWITQK